MLIVIVNECLRPGISKTCPVSKIRRIFLDIWHVEVEQSSFSRIHFCVFSVQFLQTKKLVGHWSTRGPRPRSTNGRPIFTAEKLTKDAERIFHEIVELQNIIGTEAIPALLLAVGDNLILLNHNHYLATPSSIVEGIKLELNKNH